tara:strand:+ start:45 stop:272 length:228 start_codon:yes stop_codon:yes gene_type:complete
MTITVRVQTSQKKEANDLVGNFNTLETKQLYHLIDILKNQSIKGNIITGDLFFNVSEIDHVADESFFDLVKKGDN